MSDKTTHPVHAVYDAKFNTASGLVMSLLNPLPTQIKLADIVKGLSNICRFGGQINEFYSVAKHTLLVWYLAPDHLKKAALLHDASEAYLGDIIKPLKVLINEVYGPFEDRFTEVIFNKYRVNIDQLNKIKQYDMAALGLEHEHLQLELKNSILPRIFDWVSEMVPGANAYEQLLFLYHAEFGIYDM